MRKLVVALLLFLGAPAISSAEEWKWRKPYKEAVGKENAGDLVGALAEFESIPVSERDWNTRLHIAGCKQKLGRLLDSEREYEAIRKDPAADEATVATAVDALKDVQSRIPVVKLTFSAGSEGATVSLDGATVTAPSAQRVDPGHHVIEAKRLGKSVFRREVQLSESMTLDVVVDAPSTGTAPASTAPVSPLSPPIRDESPSAKSTTPAVVAFTSAGVLLIASGVSFAAWRHADAEVGDACAQQHALSCDESAAGGSRVTTWRAVTIATGVGAVVGGVVGIMLLPSKASRVNVSLVPGAIRVGGEF